MLYHSQHECWTPLGLIPPFKHPHSRIILVFSRQQQLLFVLCAQPSHCLLQEGTPEKKCHPSFFPPRLMPYFIKYFCSTPQSLMSNVKSRNQECPDSDCCVFPPTMLLVRILWLIEEFKEGCCSMRLCLHLKPAETNGLAQSHLKISFQLLWEWMRSLRPQVRGEGSSSCRF